MTQPIDLAKSTVVGAAGADALLTVDNLKKHFPIKQGILFQRQVGAVRAVDGVSFFLNAGDAEGQVGASLDRLEPLAQH